MAFDILISTATAVLTFLVEDDLSTVFVFESEVASHHGKLQSKPGRIRVPTYGFPQRIQNLDRMIHQTEKNINEHGDKVSESDRKKITDDIEELKKIKDTEELEAIKSKTEQLVQSSLKLGEAIYKQNPQEQAPQPDAEGAEPSSEKKDDKVVDADFEEIDENKKD